MKTIRTENIDEYMEMKIRLRKAKHQVQAAESMRQYCIDLIQNIKYRFNIATSEIMGLAADIISNNSPKERELSVILNRAANLQEYCNDVVYTLRSEITNECVTEFSIQKLVNDAIYRLEDLAKEKEIEINCNFQHNMKDIVIGNIGQLQAILSQLIGSTIRFNSCCKVMITVNLFTIKNFLKRENILRFIVHDKGSGISEEKLREIKAELSDLHSELDYPRILESGLGFVNYLVNQLNGNMEITSEKSKFTTVTCDIPVQLF